MAEFIKLLMESKLTIENESSRVKQVYENYEDYEMKPGLIRMLEKCSFLRSSSTRRPTKVRRKKRVVVQDETSQNSSKKKSVDHETLSAYPVYENVQRNNEEFYVIKKQTKKSRPGVDIRIFNCNKNRMDSSEFGNDNSEVPAAKLFAKDNQKLIDYSDKVNYLVQELLEVEANYIRSLKGGMQNYFMPFDLVSLPDALKIPKFSVFSNIEVILEFHETKFLPALLECNRNPQKIANVFTSFIEGNQFDNYIGYVLNKKTSAKLCSEHISFFQQLSNDKFGINGFLLLPVQQLPRYKLLFIELIKELLKDIRKQKETLVSCCNAEKLIEKLLTKVDTNCG